MSSLIEQLLDHAQALGGRAPSDPAREAALRFIADSVAVGLAGSRHPRRTQVLQAAAAWGSGNDATEWISGRRWPAASAALLNAWQIHNQEFDCVHERAVVHPMATILPALVAVGERERVEGSSLVSAVVLAVDVAATIGSSQVAPMRFFRPAMCGALGAAVGLAALVRASRTQMADALGIAYSQLAGTMQAHAEGSPTLALQVGLAARAAVTALDLALAGFSGPRDVLEGPFGYYNLFDQPLAPRVAQVQAEFEAWARRARIEEVSHKPFPTGRAAHGALDGLRTLVSSHGLRRDDIETVELAAPPLILRLVGRPWRPDMDVNYARLCLPYLVGTWLLEGNVTLDHFDPTALRRGDVEQRARGVTWRPNDCLDPNALAPQTVRVGLRGGPSLQAELPAVLGHPARPLSAQAQREKFDHCCAYAGLDATSAGVLHAACQGLAQATTLQPWLAAMQARWARDEARPRAG